MKAAKSEMTMSAEIIKFSYYEIMKKPANLRKL